jgi:Domain of unknown function (DUF4124)
MARSLPMKALIFLMSLLQAGLCLAADTYKWVDEKGVTTYGEKPPVSRSAKPVSTQPSAVMETGGQFSRKPEVDRPDAPRPPVAVAPAAPSAPAARGMDFDVYIRLQRGMTEGELLLRAGKPDYETVDNFVGDIVRSVYYLPTISNPYTTMVTIRGGRIAELERTRKF